ncbi:MAG: inositol monophosphatase [Pseudomonadota bacterium]|nr:inositol monophosphatase [Pseudomonadota bacterium]
MDFTIDLGREAGELALAHFADRDHLTVENKRPLDLVTEADRDVENLLRARIKARFPEDGFLGEETVGGAGSSRRTWVVDPIDGTLNFLRGNDAWAVSIGVMDHDRPLLGVVYAPVRRELFSGAHDEQACLNGSPLKLAPAAVQADAVLGVGFGARVSVERQLSVLNFIVGDCAMTFRRNGAASISLMMLAQGQLDGFVAVGLSSWDVIGGVAAAGALGYGSSIDWQRVSLTDSLSFVCASKSVVERFAHYFG